MWQTAKLTDSYRANSEDRAAILRPTPDIVVLLVADGVGGQPNGGNAATLAVQLAEKYVQKYVSDLTSPSFWTQLLAAIDSELCDAPDCGETTLTTVCLTPFCITGTSVGDSEAWWVDTEGAARVLTEGHGRKPFLGRRAAFPFGFALSPPDSGTLLVATDGLFKYSYDERIAQITRAKPDDLPQTAIALRDSTCSSSGTLPDDFAAILATRQ